jgi:putative ABC transport system substrate-binding protein
MSGMGRREFVALLGGAAAALPFATHAQQPAVPVIGFLDPRSPDGLIDRLRAFRQGLKETGFVEGDTVTIVYRWAENQIDRLPALAAELVERQVALIVAAGPPAVVAAKAASTTIPSVFVIAQDPVRLGLVASTSRPGGHLTGVNFLNAEIHGKRLELLHALVPAAARVAVLVNPADAANTESTLRGVEPAARSMGLQTRILNASTSREIEAAFATLVRDRADALFVTGDGLFASRRVQFATLAARHTIPAAYSQRDYVEAGGLMSYGSNIADAYRQVGVYTAQILKGAKPADLPVLQSTKFEFVINLQTARALGLEVPNSIQLLADEVIE